MHAIAAWEVYRRAAAHGAAAAKEAAGQLAWLYPRLVTQQEYLLGRRDAGGDGLASIVHPWESGLDNSPAWDPAMAAVPADMSLLDRFHRRDLDVADAAHRPTDVDYARYIGLVLSYRDHGYSDDGLAQRHDFLVECPAFNAILGAAELALARIAAVLGADAEPHRDRAQRITDAIGRHLYDPQTCTFRARDVRTGTLSPARCVNGLIPLILPGLSAGHAAAIMAEARSDRFGLPGQTDLPVPSYDRTAPDFDTAAVLARADLDQRELAAAARHAGARLPGRGGGPAGLDAAAGAAAGHFEYFHPKNGEGIGAPAFSWTAALCLDLLADRSCPPTSTAG